jgi:hypothetical protein
MNETWAQGLLLGFGTYAALGFAFAVVVFTLGPERIDKGAAGMAWSVRLLVVPGLVALWPWLLKKWLTGQQPPVS